MSCVMKSNLFLAFVAVISTASATTRYVDLNCPTPTPPYTNWSTAATTIQDAVDAVDMGDLVLVTNGVYASGARLWNGMSNRVAVSRSRITIQSVNGPEQTIIQGWQVPGLTNGPSAIRCVYLTSSTVLSGFTLTNGATLASGNESSVCSGGGVWAMSSSAVVTNCVMTGNSASLDGGGVYGDCALYNCKLIGNSAMKGGGAYAYESYGIWLDNSIVIANCAQLGGGLYQVDVHGSVLTDNSADTGGGAAAGRLVNCTVTHNQARIGGGASGSTLVNSIVYFNRAAVANYDSGTVNNCCTTPLPPSGKGNIELDPQLASASHLSAGSPCRGAGNNGYALVTLRDLDGEAWQHPPAIGCDEYSVGAVTGALSVAISAAYTNVAAGYAVDLTAVIDGRTSASAWQFGDGTTVTNRPYVQHAWDVAGDYVVTLTAYNESYPEGLDASVVVHVQSLPVHYVTLGSTNPVTPFASWETAAGDIQSAVDAASLPGAVVVVSDGVFDTGGRVVDGLMTNRVVVGKPLTLKSLNGPAATWIAGYQVPGTTNGDGALRCVYLSAGAVLSGFTLTNGATRKLGDLEHEQKGGGVWCPSTAEVITNCVLARNSSYQRGGGVYGGTLNHCILRDNSSQYGGGVFGGLLTGCVLTGNAGSMFGGGANDSVLNNCTLTGNSAWVGGGANNSRLNNCISYFNTASSGSGVANYSGLTVNFCCTTPQPSGGLGNFTNAPLLVDLVGGDLHLQTNSPCINAGRNACVSIATDLDGQPRISGGTVDVGAYEFQLPSSVISYAWLQSYGLPTDGTADYIDSDSDGMNNWQEWIAGTCPIDSNSAFRMLTPVANLSPVTLTWQSTTNRTYWLHRAPNSATPLCFTCLASNIPGGPGTTSFSDTNAPAGVSLYRVGVQLP
jgi:hypothetical protein